MRPSVLPTICSTSGGACDPADDAPDGSNPACLSIDGSNRCGTYIDIYTSSSCEPGGRCETLDEGDGVKVAQCAANGFCVTHVPSIALGDAISSYAADPAGRILFGFDDESTGATIRPDGTYALPAADPGAPVGPNGFRIRVGDGTVVAVECTMAVDSNGPDGVGVPGGASPTLDSLLVAMPIQSP